MAEEYGKISKATMTAIADQARRLGKVSGELTPGQIEETLKGVTAGGGVSLFDATVTDKIANHIVAPVNCTWEAEVEEYPAKKYSYNGDVLPEILPFMMDGYPHAWIRNNTRTGYYDLLLSQEPWYLQDENTLAKSVEATKWYRIPIASADTSEAWTFNSDYDSIEWGNESDRRIMWSNHDIPNGSATATEIYFEGSEPVPAE